MTRLKEAVDTAVERRRGWHWLPSWASPDAVVLLSSRGVRAFADGFVSVLLPVYVLSLGFDGLQIGALATATLIGSAVLTLLVGFIATACEPALYSLLPPC